MADKRIDQLTEATSLTAVDLMVTEQSGVAKKVTGDILANSAWNMMQKDASPTKDSTAPVTSGAVYDALGGVFSPTKLATPGALVHIEDGGYNQPIQGMRIAINPVQSGEGDPSPDNVRPIIGWTAAKLTRVGKNFLENTVTTATHRNVTYTRNADGSITIQGTASGGQSFQNINHIVLPQGNYIFSVGVNTTGFVLHNGAYYNLSDGTVSFTSDGKNPCLFRLTVADGSTINLTAYPMVRLATETAPTFEPYMGEVYEVPFSSAGTVYGGTLTYNGNGTWELTVDRAKYAYQGTEQAALTQDGKYGYRIGFDLPSTARVPTTTMDRLDAISNIMVANADVVDANRYQPGQFELYPRATAICTCMCIVPLEYNTQTLAKQWLADNGFEVVYPLATPLSFTLTGPEVLTLLGINNIMADCGEIEELAYRADIGLYLVEALNPIKEMLGYREDTMTATRAYTTGDFIVVGDTFYKVAVSIANGAALTPGTNVNATTVGTQLKLLS